MSKESDPKNRPEGFVKNSDVYDKQAPPDGGWGWVIVFGSFMIHFITDGVIFSLGELYEKFLIEYNVGNGATSSIISTIIGTTLCTGPIAGVLVNIYGCRIVTICGSIIATGSILASIYANNVFTLLITMGFGSGFGIGLIYLPSIVCIMEYFQKHQSKATGIAMCGTGIGTIVYAALFKYLRSNYSMNVTIFVIAGSLMTCILYGLLFRPLALNKQNNNNENKLSNNNKRSLDNANMSEQHISTAKIEVIKREMVPLTSLTTDSEYDVDDDKTSGTENKIENIQNTAAVVKVPELQTLSEILKPANSVHNEIVISPEKPKKKIILVKCQNDFKKKLCKKILDFSIIKDPIFILFALSNFLTSLGFDVPFIFIPIQAKGKGLSKNIEYGSFLSIVGAGTIAGRIILTYIADNPAVNRLYFYNTCLTICGIITIFSTACTNVVSFNVFCLLYGFLSGSYITLTTVVTADLFGMEKMTNALGVILLFQGASAFIGPPVAGGLCDFFSSHNPAFYFSGATVALSGLILYPLPILDQYLKRRQLLKKSKNKHRNRIYTGPDNVINSI